MKLFPRDTDWHYCLQSNVNYKDIDNLFVILSLLLKLSYFFFTQTQ